MEKKLTLIIGTMEFLTIAGVETCIIYDIDRILTCADEKEVDTITADCDEDWIVPELTTRTITTYEEHSAGGVQ